MDVFVSEEILKKDYPVAAKFDADKTRLFVINLADGGSEEIEFELPFVHDSKEFTGDMCLRVSGLTIKENKYIFDEGADYTDDTVYALIGPEAFLGEPAEIYISANNRDKIEVLREFKFCGHGRLGESFTEKLYFVKIQLDRNEVFPIYLATAKAGRSQKHIVLSRSGYFRVRFRTTNQIISIDGEETEQYVAISELS